MTDPHLAPVTNPAFELHDLISTWALVPQGSTVRDVRVSEEEDYWPLHSRATVLIIEIDDYLNEREVITRRKMSRVSLDHIKDMVSAKVYALCDAAANGPVSLVSEEDLAWLESLGANWSRGGFVPPEALRELSNYIKAIDEYIVDAGLASSVQQYMLELCNALARAITDARVSGGRDVLRLAMELSAALDTFTKDEGGRSYSKQIREFWEKYGVPVMIEVAGATSMLAITSGIVG